MTKDRLLFFTTKNCQLCKPIKEAIKRGDYPNLNIEIVDDDIELMIKYKVKSVPTLVVDNTDEVSDPSAYVGFVGAARVLEVLGEMNGICS